MGKPLYDKESGAVVGHLTEPVSVKSLTVGDVVWDELNDEPATFHGWSHFTNCYVFSWVTGGDFCGWDLDSSSRPAMWRKVVVKGKPCACGIPNQANFHTHVILSRPHPCGVGTETTYTDIYTCSEHTYGETDTRKMLQWDGHEAWEIVEVSQTALR